MTDEQAEREASRTQAPAADAVLEADGADARAGTFRAPSTVTLDPSDYVGWAATMQAMLEYGGLWEHVAPRGERLPASTAPLAASSSSVTATVAPGRHTQKAREAYLKGLAETPALVSDAAAILPGINEIMTAIAHKQNNAFKPAVCGESFMDSPQPGFA